MVSLKMEKEKLTEIVINSAIGAGRLIRGDEEKLGQVRQERTENVYEYNSKTVLKFGLKSVPCPIKEKAFKNFDYLAAQEYTVQLHNFYGVPEFRDGCLKKIKQHLVDIHDLDSGNIMLKLARSGVENWRYFYLPGMALTGLGAAFVHPASIIFTASFLIVGGAAEYALYKERKTGKAMAEVCSESDEMKEELETVNFKQLGRVLLDNKKTIEQYL